jgi:hypothetical protein
VIQSVAISDYRILKIEGGRVTFRYRDRADGDTEKLMTLSADLFIRRFLLHILPPGLQKIRFFGWMGRNASVCPERRKSSPAPATPTRIGDLCPPKIRPPHYRGKIHQNANYPRPGNECINSIGNG